MSKFHRNIIKAAGISACFFASAVAPGAIGAVAFGPPGAAVGVGVTLFLYIAWLAYLSIS